MASSLARSCLKWGQFEEAVGDTVLVNDNNLFAVAKELLGVVDDLDGDRFFLDLRDVRLVSPATWEVLLQLRRRLLTRGKRLCLCHVGPEVSEVLETTKVNRVFDIQLAVGQQFVDDPRRGV
jgi:anti-anti-sigma factor